MLLKITDQCKMNCSHCFDDSHSIGSFMKQDVFDKSIELMLKLKPSLVLVSGGEPTEHPFVIEYLDALCFHFPVVLITNGSFLENQTLTEAILKRNIFIQITNDSRYYPSAPIPYTGRSFEEEIALHKQMTLVTEVPLIINQGRAFTSNLTIQKTFGPKCFNLIQMVSLMGFQKALSAQEDMCKFCNPSIKVDGGLSLGEASTCRSYANVMDANPLMTIEMNVTKELEFIKTTKRGSCDNCHAWTKYSSQYGATYGQMLSILAHQND